MIDFEVYFNDPSSRSYEELEDFVFKSGFEDANFGSSDGVYMLSFEDEMDNLDVSIKMAWQRVSKAGLVPFAIGPEDNVRLESHQKYIGRKES